MSEDPVSRCPECEAPVERVFHPVAVHFKGSGFYTTDYARGGRSDGKGGKPSEGKKDAEKQSSDSGSANKDTGGDKAKASSSGD